MKTRTILTFGLSLAATAVLPALDINLVYVTNGQAGSIPGGDPNGNRLMAVAEAAANYWEDIVEDNHSIDVLVRYDNGIGTGFVGLWTMGSESIGRPDSGTIGIRGTTTWYYDQTPNDHSE